MENGGISARDSLLWVLLTCAIAATTALIAFSIGSSLGGGETGASERRPPKTAAPAFLPIPDIYASARADGYRAGSDRSYARGRRDGLEEGRRAARRGYQRAMRDTLGPLKEGQTYVLCRNGRALCRKARR